MKTGLLIILLSLSFSLYAQNPQKVYEFELGKYHILDYPVNVRSQPGLNGSVIGKLDFDSEIEIIENTKKEQTIDNKTHYWYKINYKNLTGYIWGGLIAVDTKSLSLEGNKIMAYFRYSYIEGTSFDNINYYYRNMVLPDDIFIYINQKRINIIDVVKKVYLEEYSLIRGKKYFVRDFWNYCGFFEKDGNIILFISDYSIASSTFVIDKYGKITHKESEISDTN